MPIYRKKPVEIEAERCSVLLNAASSDWEALPGWAAAAYELGELVFAAHGVYVKTLEGTMFCDRESMLIRGVQGELYPCKPDIFAATYDLVT